MAYSVTTDHEEIRKWVDSNDGYPAIIKGTANEDVGGALRVDFHNDPNLEHINWDVFFSHFETGNLAFAYDDERQEPAEGRFKLVNRDNAEQYDPAILPDVGDDKRASENLYSSADEDDVGEQEEWESEEQVWS